MDLSFVSARSCGRGVARFTAAGTICKACRRNIQRRAYSAAAAAVQTEQGTSDHAEPPAESAALEPSYQVKAGVLLARAPLLTRELTSFEKAFFLYQRRLNERLSLPFTRYFYFKRDTPAMLEWKRKIKQRRTPARDIGQYDAYSDESWNDEVLVGAPESEPEHQVDALVKDAESPGVASVEALERREEIERPLPRLTEADEEDDRASLNRQLDRTLYLLGKGSRRHWELPTVDLLYRETLQQAAERILVQAGGVNMNTWVLGNHPVGHHRIEYEHIKPIEGKRAERVGEMTFFMKARIMAGQPLLEGNQLGLTAFQWLCKEEIQQVCHPTYWNSIRCMLGDR